MKSIARSKSLYKVDNSQIEELKNKLIEEKVRLEKELSEFAKKDPEVKGNWDAKFPQFGDITSNQEENTDEVEEYITALPIEHELETRLQDINSALEKIKKGGYGKCEGCEKEIALERLQVNPEARTCIDCAK